MSNGYLLAAEADLDGVREIAAGFGLEAIGATTLGGQDATASALSGAANVGIVLSQGATRDATFVALLLALSASLRAAQLILASPDARDAFPFLPASWPAMALDEARTRSADLVRRRAEHEASTVEPPRAHPLPQVEETPAPAAPEPPIRERPDVSEDAAPEQSDDVLSEDADTGVEEAPSGQTETPASAADDAADDLTEDTLREEESDDGATVGGALAEEAPSLPDSFGAGRGAPMDEDAAAEAPAPAPPSAEPPPAVAPAPAPQAAEPPRQPARTREPTSETAPADATAFAPKKLRRGSPELIRIVIHQPKDLQAVIKAARKIDPRTDPAPSGMSIGDVALGASVAVALEVRGAACDGALQRRTWQGEALDFNFSVEPDADVKQAVFLARVFVDDAQIGVLAFTRPVGGAHKAAHATGDRVRLKRHKRVFISYSSKDRETVAAIATAYQAAGVEHFFDRTSLKSGEEWSPRLRQEIDRADLFHLCWSKAAAASEWVEKEAEHALTRRRRAKKPDITVQMLDGPPWAAHPRHQDSINFDDFVRAAIVGYARGENSQ